jgi:3'-phosphoadenosine 5'-phosphosulfate sulfotransferase (PAPS reductase)/FAD synthetase
MKSIRNLINSGALFVINHSGGKDSQAMTARLVKVIPVDQLVIIHAELPGVDWEGLVDHINANSFGIPVYVCRAGKTFFEMVERRGMFPSPKYRQCTSDLKRGPIEKQIRAIAKERGCKLIVNCMGLRADESASRKKLAPWSMNKKQSVAGRTWLEWLPIHGKSTRDVMLTIKNAGQKPHFVYSDIGLGRCSCKICIFSTEKDVKIIYEKDRSAFDLYSDMEKKINYSFIMPKKGKDPMSLLQIVGAE